MLVNRVNMITALTSPSYDPEKNKDNAEGCFDMHWIPSLCPSKEHRKGFASKRSNFTAFNARVYSRATSKGWRAGSKFLWTKKKRKTSVITIISKIIGKAAQIYVCMYVFVCWHPIWSIPIVCSLFLGVKDGRGEMPQSSIF